MLKEYLYCSQCRPKLDIAVPSFRLLLSSENLMEKEAIEPYSNSGFSYNAILCFLEKYHDMSIIEVSNSTKRHADNSGNQANT